MTKKQYPKSMLHGDAAEQTLNEKQSHGHMVMRRLTVEQLSDSLSLRFLWHLVHRESRIKASGLVVAAASVRRHIGDGTEQGVCVNNDSKMLP